MPYAFKVCDALGQGKEREGVLDDLCRFTENLADRFVPNPITTVKNVVNTVSDIVDILVEPTSDCDTLTDRGDSCPAIPVPDGVTPPDAGRSMPGAPKPEDTPINTIPIPSPLPQPSNQPTIIYDENDENQPEFRYYPLPILPPNRKQKDKPTTVTVTETLDKRKFGCLLHEPITSTPVKVRVCIEPTEADILIGDAAQSNAIDTFVAWQAKKKGLTLPQEILEDPTIDFSDLGLIYWRNYHLSTFEVPNYQMLFGRKAIAGLASYYNRQNVTGIFQIRSMASESVELEICSKDNLPNDQPFDTTLGSVSSGNECFIPIRNFKENHEVGYKRQLQIIFISKTTGKPKEITIPDPREDLTATEIKEAIKSSSIYTEDGLRFGKYYKAEQTIISDNMIGYFRYYGGVDYVDSKQQTENEAKDLFSRLATLAKGELKNDFKPTIREYNHINNIGYFKPSKAYIFNFKNDGTEPDCIRFDLR